MASSIRVISILLVSASASQHVRSEKSTATVSTHGQVKEQGSLVQEQEGKRGSLQNIIGGLFPSQLSEDASLSLYVYPNITELPGFCQGPVGKKVDDLCCSRSLDRVNESVSVNGPLSRSLSGTDFPHNFSCFGVDLGGGAWVRDYLGCAWGELVAAEGCMPTNHGFAPLTGTGAAQWPISNDYRNVVHSMYEDGDANSCKCGYFNETSHESIFPSIYHGAGCYSALGVADLGRVYLSAKSTDKTAFFVKVTGSCNWAERGDTNSTTK